MADVYDHGNLYEELARVLIRVSFVLRQDMDVELASLSAVPREILRIVVRSPGLSVSDVATLAGRQQSNTSIALNQLVEAGLVRREPSPLDRRSSRVFPTPEAMKAMRGLYQGWAASLQEWVERLPRAERNRVVAAIPALVRLTSIAEAGRPPLG